MLSISEYFELALFSMPDPPEGQIVSNANRRPIGQRSLDEHQRFVGNKLHWEKYEPLQQQ